MWRGVKLDARSAAMMDEVAYLMKDAPGGDVYIRPTQGAYNAGGVTASAGTHDGGGVLDVDTDPMTVAQRDYFIELSRRVGFGGWFRTAAQGFVPHAHLVAVGCPDLSSGAAYQVREYFAGRNGLAGRGADDGPRQYVGATWESYLAAKPKSKPAYVPSGETMEPTVFTIVTDQGADAGQWFAAAGNVMFQPLDNSCNEKNGWKQVRVTRRQFDVIYARHCTVNRLNPQTYTAL